MRRTILAAAILSTFACDTTPRYEPAATFRSVNTPGAPWGPCSAVECEFGSVCVKTEVGTYCAPNCASPACTKVQVDACGDIIGEGTASCWGDFVCKRLCASDADCGLGMICSTGDGFCVTPGE